MQRLMVSLLAVAVLAGCGKDAAEVGQGGLPQVTIQTIKPVDAPLSFQFVGQTQSSRQVQIVARVDGFLDKRVYTEGNLVKAGEVMFLQDPKPFQATLDAARGALAEQQARLQVAVDNLAQVKPLAALKALSQKDLDDATGQRAAAAAGVQTAKANVEQARLNLSYTKITTPVTGLSSYARVQDGAYVNSTNSLLTYVEQVDPIWVNFSVSDNQMLQFRNEQAKGLMVSPKQDDYEVEVELADGSLFPGRGQITFADADFNQQTGTFLMRATLPNPEALLRPGQFVRVHVHGATRPNAVLVPQKAVMQGAQGHFVVVLDGDDVARLRPVQVGQWEGPNWFINAGLSAGDRVVTDGVVHLTPGIKVKVTGESTLDLSAAPAAAKP